MRSFITFFLQWTEHRTRPRIMDKMQNFPRGNVQLHCVVRPDQAQQKRCSHFQQRPSAWDLFSQSNVAHVPLPVTPVSVHSSYTPFRNTNRYLDGMTALGTRHKCRSSSHTHGIITNIHWNMTCGLSKDHNGEKVFPFL